MKSIKDIAIEANVSAGTVDRVIHNRGGVSEKTKNKVLKIIKESNFSINPVASSLASKKRHVIASLVPSSHNSDFWKFPQDGIKEKIEQFKSYGFQLQEFYFDQFSPSSYIESFDKLIDSKPNAVIIAPVFTKETLGFVKQLEEKNIPFVCINVEIEGVNSLSFVGQSSYEGGFLAGKMMKLHNVNLNVVGVVEIRENVSNYNAIEQRILGFEDYFKLNYPKVKINRLQFKFVNSKKETSDQLSNYLEIHSSDNALFIPSSETSKIIRNLNEGQLRNSIIIGFDTTVGNVKYLKRGTIDVLIGQQPFKQGLDAVQILFDYLVNKKTPESNYYLPLQIVVKENIDFLDF